MQSLLLTQDRIRGINLVLDDYAILIIMVLLKAVIRFAIVGCLTPVECNTRLLETMFEVEADFVFSVGTLKVDPGIFALTCSTISIRTQFYWGMLNILETVPGHSSDYLGLCTSVECIEVVPFLRRLAFSEQILADIEYHRSEYRLTRSSVLISSIVSDDLSCEVELSGSPGSAKNCLSLPMLKLVPLLELEPTKPNLSLKAFVSSLFRLGLACFAICPNPFAIVTKNVVKFSRVDTTCTRCWSLVGKTQVVAADRLWEHIPTVGLMSDMVKSDVETETVGDGVDEIDKQAELIDEMQLKQEDQGCVHAPSNRNSIEVVPCCC
ncbi:hypothetical protein Tco_0020017 [Tanacetum coccineum]